MPGMMNSNSAEADMQRDRKSQAEVSGSAMIPASDPQQVWLGQWLKSIDDSLKSIKNILTFFVILAVLGIVVAGCSTLLSFGR